MARKGMNIYKRKDGRWEGRYIKGYNSDGKAVYVSVYGSKYNEVKTKLLPYKYQFINHKKIIVSEYCGLLQDWLAYWIQSIAKPNIKPSTYASYQSKMTNHILPDLGGKQLDALTPHDIQQFIGSLVSKGLAYNSVCAIFRVLNTALSSAEEIKAITANPCKGVKLPKKIKTKIEALTSSQQQSLKRAAMRDKDGAAVIVALYTGMRIGEICALEWTNIDFEASTLYVEQTMERITNPDGADRKTRIVFSSPKTVSSFRAIPLPKHLEEYLLNLKAVADSNFVVSCKGGFAEPRIVRYRFQRILKAAGLPAMRFHSLRHTFATRCIEHNVDITTLSRLLGHKSPTLTLDTYTHSLLQQQKHAMSIVDQLFIDEPAKNTAHNQRKEQITQLLAMLLEEETMTAF